MYLGVFFTFVNAQRPKSMSEPAYNNPSFICQSCALQYYPEFWAILLLMRHYNDMNGLFSYILIGACSKDSIFHCKASNMQQRLSPKSHIFNPNNLITCCRWISMESFRHKFDLDVSWCTISALSASRYAYSNSKILTNLQILQNSATSCGS